MKKTRNTIILALSLCIAVTAWSAARSRAKAKPVTQEQPSARLLTREPRSKNEPVGIKEVLIRGKRKRAHESFNDTKDFLKGVQVHIYNRSQKDIAFAEVGIMVKADTSLTSKSYLMYAEFGDPELRKRAAATGPDRLLKPGQHAIIRVADSQYALLDHDGVNSPVVTFNVDFVIFADDTAWSHGEQLVRDPANSAQWWVSKPKLNHARKPQLNHASTANLRPDDAPCSHYTFTGRGLVGCTIQNTTNTCTIQSDSYTTAGSLGNFNNAPQLLNCSNNGGIEGPCPGCDYNNHLVACSGAGGGSGGGKGGGQEGDSCFSDSDCDFGFSCNDSGYCDDGFIME